MLFEAHRRSVGGFSGIRACGVIRGCPLLCHLPTFIFETGRGAVAYFVAAEARKCMRIFLIFLLLVGAVYCGVRALVLGAARRRRQRITRQA
jgi:hypothetical protein